jgi:hypothetical protein
MRVPAVARPVRITRRQRDAQLPSCPVGGPQEDAVGHAQAHHLRIGRVLLEVPLDVVGALDHRGEAFLAAHLDVSSPGLPGQFHTPHGC